MQTVSRTSLFQKKGKDGGRKKREGGRKGGCKEERKFIFTVPPFTIFKILSRADITCAKR